MPRPAYVHMMPLEVPIWERFLRSGQLQLDRYEYDIHVGEGAPIPDDATEAEIRQIQAITQKRIDAVGWGEGAVWLIEVKPRAGHSAAGALLNYARLFKEKYRPSLPIRLAVVCERTEWDVSGYYQELGIEVFLV